LCAQWKAADAAKESAEWAGSTFWLGVAGAAISFLTLLAAGFAAWYARKAALHTADSVDQAERAAKAAEDTLDETRRVTAAQLRPYVSFTEPRKRDDEPFSRESNLYIAIQNFGQIPALDVRLSMGENFLVEPIKDTQIPLVVVDASYGMIAPGDKREDSIRTKNMHPSEIARAAEGKVTLFIRLRLDYDWDGGSDSHEMTLALVDPIKNDWVMVDKRRRYQIQ
jgi:hypothetical protein